MGKTSHTHLAHLTSFQPRPVVFCTVCVHQRKPCLNNSLAHEILKDIWFQSADKNGWWVGHYVLMPDPVHFFARSGWDAVPLADWMRTWKSLSSREFKKQLKFPIPFWQPDYFDRYLRSAENYADKWLYVSNNPVRAGLCADSDSWPFQGCIHPLKF
jgi:putative transposase